MQSLPAEPSFSVLHSSLSHQPLGATHVTFEAVCAGIDAVVPFVGIIPRLAIGGVTSWTDKKHQRMRGICKRLHALHERAEKALQSKRVTQQWVDAYETLLFEFIAFAAAYERKSRLIARVTRKITTEDDQRAIAAFTGRIDDLFLQLKGVVGSGNAKEDEDEDSDTTSSDSTASP